MTQAETTFHAGSSPRKPRINWRRPLVIGGFAVLTGVAGWWAYQAVGSNSLLGQNTTATTTVAAQTTPGQVQNAPAAAGANTSSASEANVQAVVSALPTAATPDTSTNVSANVLTQTSVPAIASVQGAQLRRDDGNLLATLPSGSILTATAATPDGAWLAVKSGSGAGWVPADQVIAFGVQTLSTASLPLPVLMAAAPPVVPAAEASSTAVSTTGLLLATDDEPVTPTVVQAGETTAMTMPATDGAEATLQAAITSESTVLTVIVSTGGDRLNVRSGPGADYGVIDKVADGAVLTVVGRTAAGDWLQIQVPAAASTLGWVAASYVQVSGPTMVAPVTM